MTENRFAIEHRPSENQYVLRDQDSEGGDAVIGELTYVSLVHNDDDEATTSTRRILDHTGVRETYTGQGLASRLVRFALDDSIRAGVTIVPVCPYITSWLKKHPDYAAHTVKATREDLAAVRS